MNFYGEYQDDEHIVFGFIFQANDWKHATAIANALNLIWLGEHLQTIPLYND